MPNLKRNIILSIVFIFIVYLFLSFFADFDSLVQSIITLSFSNHILLLFIAIAIVSIKFYRWHQLLSTSGISISIRNSILVFLSGLVMSITPGKLGELFKSYLLKKYFKIELLKSLPVIIAERVTEFISLLFLSILFLIFMNQYDLVLIILLFSFSFAVILLFNARAISMIINLLGNISFLKIDQVKRKVLLDNLSIFRDTKTYLISISAWLFEFFGFYIILFNFVSDINVIKAFSLYSFALIIGSISMLPGGIGTTESSLAFILIQEGFLKADSFAATFLIRAFTLWFAIFIGLIATILFLKINRSETAQG